LFEFDELCLANELDPEQIYNAPWLKLLKLPGSSVLYALCREGS